MVSTKMAGIKQAGEDVKKLAELMDRFHTLSSLYESKPKGAFRREKTYHEGSRASPSLHGTADEFPSNDVNSIPKPIPPLVRRKGRKANFQKNTENGKHIGRDNSKGKDFMAKLHTGNDVGVKVFRLKDSVVEENVLQSVPVAQEDVKYSFHQPPQLPISSEASLYQDALASSRKYVNLNSRNHRLKVHNGNATFDTSKANADHSLLPVRANTISDFNIGHKVRRKHRNSYQQTQSGLKSNGFAKENFDISSHETKQNVESKTLDNVSKEMTANKRKSTMKKTIQETSKNEEGRIFQHSDSSITSEVYGQTEEAVMRQKLEQTFETNLKKASEKIAENADSFSMQQSIDKIPTSLKMPKFVRSNEEISGHPDDQTLVSNKMLQDKRQEMSANSYYLSTYPYLTSLSSIGASEQQGYSPESRLSMHDKTSFQPQTPANSLQTKTTPSSSPTKSRPITPSTPKGMKRDGPRLYPIASIQKAYDVQTREKISGGRKTQRKPLPGKQGKIRKAASVKDPNLETCVQGRSFMQVMAGSETEADIEPQKLNDNDNDEDRRRKKVKVRREMSKSSGSSSKNTSDLQNKDETTKKSQGSVPSLFNAYESFVIRSKHPVQHIARTSPDAYELKSSKLTQRPQGKLAPLMKLNKEMRKSKFILARTDKNISKSNQSPVRLVSDPVTFSVRHPLHACSTIAQEEKEAEIAPKPSRDLLLGRLEGLHNPDNGTEETLVVFFHHEPANREKHQFHHLQYGKIGKHSMDDTIPESDESPSRSSSKLLPEALKRKEDLNLLEKPTKVQKREKSHGDVTFEDCNHNKSDENEMYSHLKKNITAQRLKNDQATFLRLMEQDLLKTREVAAQQMPTAPKTMNLHSLADLEGEPTRLSEMSTMWKKFYGPTDGKQKPTSYAMLASGYPVKHDNAVEHRVKIQGSETQLNKIRQATVKLNYSLPVEPERRYSYPFGHPVKPPIKPVKSVSTGSDTSSTKSLTITDLNLELNPEDRHKHWFMPHLGRGSVPMKIQQRLGHFKDENHPLNGQHFTVVTLPEIHRAHFLAGANHDRQLDGNSGTFIYLDPNSAAILPDPGTTSYRLAHDVSFDEGSRYRTTDFPHGLKGNELRNQTDHGLNGLPRQLTSAVAMRNHENGRLDGRIPNRDHSLNNNHLPYKDTVPISLIRMEDRCELPPAASPSSPAMSSAIASASNSFIPPPSASRLTTSSSTSIPSNSITFRLHKEKHNWNYRLGELSINGGGYSNSVPALANSKPEVESSHRMNMTSAVQRNLQTREKAVAVAPRSRISSRYSNKNDANAEPAYSDPCISAPPSFQQRLTDLSLLESETVKYERNRKLRRKKNQDKDKDS